MLRAFGKPVDSLEVTRRGCWAHIIGGKSAVIGVPFDHISWTSDDWDSKDAVSRHPGSKINHPGRR